MDMDETKELKCPKCESKVKQYKHGTTSKGKPRFRCKICFAVYSFEPPRYSEEFKRESVQLYLEGNSGRAVGRIRKISKNTIWGWLKEYADNLPAVQENDVETAEQDELCTYIKKDK
jgi:transposase-like protein